MRLVSTWANLAHLEKTQLLKAAPSPASPYPSSAVGSFKKENGLRAKEMRV